MIYLFILPIFTYYHEYIRITKRFVNMFKTKLYLYYCNFYFFKFCSYNFFSDLLKAINSPYLFLQYLHVSVCNAIPLLLRFLDLL